MLRLHTNIEHPQPRHIERACQFLRGGGLAVYPTDTTYGMGCDLFSKRSIDRIYQLKGLDKRHRMSFLCQDLSQVSEYAVLEDKNYRILRHHLPGPYTFILPATKLVPKIIQSKARTVGVRIPKSPVCLALLQELGHPIITTTASRRWNNDTESLNDPDQIVSVLGRSVEVFLDGGDLSSQPSTVVDLTESEPKIIRKGSGDLDWLVQEG